MLLSICMPCSDRASAGVDVDSCSSVDSARGLSFAATRSFSVSELLDVILLLVSGASARGLVLGISISLKYENDVNKLRILF